MEALDVSVTVSLAWPEGQSPGRKQRELPQLELAERMTQVSDSQGRVFFGDVYIREGSGQVEPGSTEPTMEMELLFRAESSRGYSSWITKQFNAVLFKSCTLYASSMPLTPEKKNHPLSLSNFLPFLSALIWPFCLERPIRLSLIWWPVSSMSALDQLPMCVIACREPCGQCKCLVLFSDDAQRFLVLQQLNENQQVLASKRQSLVHQLEQAKDSTASASGEYRSACRAVERRQKEVAIT